MNLQQFRQGIQVEARRLGKPLPTKLVANYAVNKAGDELLRDTTVARVQRTLDAVAGQSRYPVTGNVLESYRAAYNGKPLIRTSTYDLDAYHGTNWETYPGTPSHWYMPEIDVFRPWPTPKVSLADGFRLDISLGWEVDLARDSDDPRQLNGLPTKYHRALIHKAVMDLWEDQKAAAEYMVIVRKIQNDLSEQFSTAAGFVPYRHL